MSQEQKETELTKNTALRVPAIAAIGGLIFAIVSTIKVYSQIISFQQNVYDRFNTMTMEFRELKTTVENNTREMNRENYAWRRFLNGFNPTLIVPSNEDPTIPMIKK